MDTSEVYIKMCEKAKEIQDSWIPKWGDWLYDTIDGEIRCCGDVHVLDYIMREFDHYEGEGQLRCDMCVWIPRQDQLQEMLNLFPLTAFGAGLIKYDEMVGGCYDQFQDSWEKLWLAFVMKEKYNKVWNGEDWEEA